MAKQIVMKARLREETGKNEMKRLRSKGDLPGIIYGRSGETVQVAFTTRALENIIHSDTGFNTIFGIEIDGLKQEEPTPVMIKEYQLDPVTHDFLHVSFYRVHMDRLYEVSVAVNPVGVAPGVKEQGGTLDIILREIRIECLPGDIPESIDVDLSSLRIGDQVRVSDLAVSDTIKVLEDHEAVVLHVIAPRKAEELEPEEGVLEAGEGEAEAGEESSEEEKE